MKNFFIVAIGFIPFLFLAINPSFAQFEDCVTSVDEDNPLRPYPGKICDTTAPPDEPYCATRPWAVESFEYLRNIQGCAEGDNVYPCVQAYENQTGCGTNLNNLPCIAGNYSIDLSQYELPLVSVNRPEFNDLTFFNRAQEHIADYLEGRSYYEGLAEPTLSQFDSLLTTSVWTRLGIFRKLTSYFLQNEMKRENIRRARAGSNQTIHNYTVSYYSNNEPANWGTGNQMKMTSFIGHEPPVNNCSSLPTPEEREACQTQFFNDLEAWEQTIYGKLWAYVPMTTREDSVGYVNMIPDPALLAPQSPITTAVSIPHLKRLDFVSDYLNRSLSSLVREPGPQLVEETAFMGSMCPAGPWSFCPNYAFGCGASGSCRCEYPNQAANCHASNSTDHCVRDYDFVVDLASRWVDGFEGNKVADCYGDVIDHAKAANIDPALAMIIWLNESNASNYHLSCWDFGVLSEPNKCNFEAQIDFFMRLPGGYPSRNPNCYDGSIINPATGLPLTPLEAFLAIFRSGDCDALGIGYANHIKSVYSWVGSCGVPNSPFGVR